MDNTLVVTCNKCKAKYEVPPAVEYPGGGGVYSSDADFCKECDSSDIKAVFKDGRPVLGRE